MSLNGGHHRSHIAHAFREFAVRDFLRIDLAIGVLGAVGGAWLGWFCPTRLVTVAGPALGVTGVIVGAVLAGVSVQAAFLDTSFLRLLHAIGRKPVRYLTPFLFTTILGVWAMLALLVLGALTSADATWLLASVGSLSGLLSFWAVGSLLPCISTLIQFIDLRSEAALIDEERNPDPGPGDDV